MRFLSSFRVLSDPGQFLSSMAFSFSFKSRMLLHLRFNSRPFAVHPIALHASYTSCLFFRSGATRLWTHRLESAVVLLHLAFALFKASRFSERSLHTVRRRAYSWYPRPLYLHFRAFRSCSSSLRLCMFLFLWQRGEVFPAFSSAFSRLSLSLDRASAASFHPQGKVRSTRGPISNPSLCSSWTSISELDASHCEEKRTNAKTKPVMKAARAIWEQRNSARTKGTCRTKVFDLGQIVEMTSSTEYKALQVYFRLRGGWRLPMRCSRSLCRWGWTLSDVAIVKKWEKYIADGPWNWFCVDYIHYEDWYHHILVFPDSFRQNHTSYAKRKYTALLVLETGNAVTTTLSFCAAFSPHWMTRLYHSDVLWEFGCVLRLFPADDTGTEFWLTVGEPLINDWEECVDAHTVFCTLTGCGTMDRGIKAAVVSGNTITGV